MVAAHQETVSILADALRGLPPEDRAVVREVWVRFVDGHAEYEVYAETIPEEQELRLYALEDALFARQPEPYPMVSVVHAGNYENDPFIYEPRPGSRQIYPSSAAT